MITLCKILKFWFTDIVSLIIQTLSIKTVEEHINDAFHYTSFRCQNELKHFYFNNY